MWTLSHSTQLSFTMVLSTGREKKIMMKDIKCTNALRGQIAIITIRWIWSTLVKPEGKKLVSLLSTMVESTQMFTLKISHTKKKKHAKYFAGRFVVLTSHPIYHWASISCDFEYSGSLVRSGLWGYNLSCDIASHRRQHTYIWNLDSATHIWNFRMTIIVIKTKTAGGKKKPCSIFYGSEYGIAVNTCKSIRIRWLPQNAACTADVFWHGAHPIAKAWIRALTLLFVVERGILHKRLIYLIPFFSSIVSFERHTRTAHWIYSLGEWWNFVFTRFQCT